MLRFTRPVIWLSALTVASFLTAAAVVAAVGLADHVERADMVVVPGNTVYPDGTPSDRLKGRLDAAIEIYRAGNCDAIFVSGAVGSEGVDESSAMREYLIEQGVPLKNIIQDSYGFNTEATARNAATAMQQQNFHTVLAASQYFHVLRLRLLLRRQGLSVTGNSHAKYFELRDAYSLAREVIAIARLIFLGNTI